MKEILYNGSPISGSLLQPNFQASKQALSVIIADKAATLNGVFSAKGDAVPDARIYIVPWPARLTNGYPDCLQVTTDRSGRFSKTGLAPGTYRVLGIRASEWQRLDLPNVMSALAGDAVEVKLGEGQANSATVELTEM